jgi:hypothetical protein
LIGWDLIDILMRDDGVSGGRWKEWLLLGFREGGLRGREVVMKLF